jgi:hypothetical protein
MKRLIASFALGLILPSFVSFAVAQSLTTGAIAGVVVDQSGAVMGSVVVTAKNVDTGGTRETQTGGGGNFLLAQLDPGRYEVTAESAGFEKAKSGPITVAVSRVASLQFKLKIGSATATVEVKQEASLIEPDNPNTTTTLNAAQLAEIPNPGNDLSYVANLAPGALMNVGSVHFGGAGNVEFNGLPSVANSFSIDGLDANNPFFNTNASGVSGLQLGLNAIQEVSINTASYSVDQGRQEAAQINYITKSGTNSFHGNAYEIWNGSAMNARNFFNNLKGIVEKPRSNVNEFGASVGGPVLKNKLFFFADVEGTRMVLPTTLTSTLPTSVYQTYVLQQLPLGGTDTVFGDQLPPQPAEVPLYQNMFKLIGNLNGGIPMPVLGCPLNLDGSPAAGSPPNGDGCATTKTVSVAPPISETLYTAKLDYTLSSKDAFWFRFQLNNGSQILPDAVNSIFNTVGSAPNRSGAAGWTHVFSPSLVNQFNPGMTYNKLINNIADPSQAHALFPLTYSVAPFSDIGGFQDGLPFGVATTVWQLNDNLAWNHGSHAFKFGENMRRVLISAFTNSFGVIPLEIGCTLPEFTYGATCLTVQSFPKSSGDRIASVNLDLYAMDTFRATNKLTLTIGVRTAWNSNPVSRHKNFSRLADSFESISHDVNQPLNQVILSNQRKAYASSALLQWQPRAALAYEVMSKTVLRSGFGIFATTLEGGQAPVELSLNAPLDPTFNGGLFGVGGVGIAAGVPNSAVDAAVAANQQFQANFANGALSCVSPLASQTSCVPSVNFRAFQGGQLPYPYSMQWSSSIEHQFGKDYGVTVKYVGTRAVKMESVARTMNSFQSWCQGCFAPLPFNGAPDPRFGQGYTYSSDASSSYHALQVTGQKRVSHGLSFQINYTYSHCLDTFSNGAWSGFNFNSTGAGNLPVSLKHYYGNCDYDVRHSINGSYLYELPLHPRRAWLGYAIGGWSVSGTMFLRGGFPFSVFSGGSRKFFNGNPLIRANLVPGVNAYTQANIPGVTQPGTIQWLNSNAFQSVFDSTTGTCFPTTNVQNCEDGDSGRNTFRAPGFKWTDLDIGKRFKIRENISFKFDAQFYNLFNHPNFFLPSLALAGIPGKSATLTGFGTISETAMPSTGLLGGRLGDSSVRMIAFRGRIEF